MPKYTVVPGQEDISDDYKLIVVESATTPAYMTINDMMIEISCIKSEVGVLIERHNSLIDRLKDIKESTDIEMPDIPQKL